MMSLSRLHSITHFLTFIAPPVLGQTTGLQGSAVAGRFVCGTFHGAERVRRKHMPIALLHSTTKTHVIRSNPITVITVPHAYTHSLSTCWTGGCPSCRGGTGIGVNLSPEGISDRDRCCCGIFRRRCAATSNCVRFIALPSCRPVLEAIAIAAASFLLLSQ